MRQMLSSRRWAGLLTALLVLSAAGEAASPNTKGKIARSDGQIGAPYVEEPAVINWSGPYVGLGVGVLAGLGAVEVEEPPLLDGVGAWGWVGDAKVGYDYRFQGTPFVIGLFGGYSLGGAEITGFGEHISLTPTWNAGVRGGLVAWNSNLLYVGGGYEQADIDVSFADGPGTIGGWFVLGGMEMPVSKAVTMGLEYKYTNWDSFTIDEARANPEDHRVMLRANLRFGGFGQ